MSGDRSTWPLMVRLGLWGVRSRKSAWAFFWLSVAIAIACVAYGFVNPRFFAGGVMLLAAVWYLLAIRWVDTNGEWS
ncbi:MAG TPA: hypothetical protein ENJ16_05045 [Planctomycetaceae bacterium]|nr:hypothetical protein [Planctomycetaceae bacterium]